MRAGCTKTTNSSQETNTVSKTNVTPTAAFALDLLKQEVAAKTGENVLISPLSVSVALGMTANGARGTTLKGMTSTLGIDADQSTNNKGYAALLEKLKRDGIGVTLDVANAIFARLGMKFEKDFLAANKEFFSAKVEELDFNDPETLNVINGFVSEATNKKIDEILKDPIAADTVMFLVNCVYFKGEWTVKFDKDATKDLPFEGVGDIPLMYKNDSMIYGRDKTWDTYQFVSLPFGESKAVRMIVVLPDDGKTIDDVLAKLDAETLEQHAQQQYENDGELWLPRIEIKYDNSLAESLKALGMEEAFGGADFSGMIPPPAQLFIKDVKHKTFFKVDEEGAEGAAATSVEIGLECVRMPHKVKCDKPFVTFVIDSETNGVLFAGVIVDPTK